MICNIVAGSPDFNIDTITLKDADLYIGVDFGAYLLIKHNVQLDVAIGDFDSIGTTQFVEILNSSAKVYKYEKEKDETDTELALKEAIKAGATHINLYGATGRRLDHFLGTLNLFHQLLDENVTIHLIDEHNRIYILRPGTHTIKKSDYTYISFFSYLKPVINLTLSGFKYKLNSYTLKNDDTRCVSNEIVLNDAKITFTDGFLLVVESSD